MVRAILIALGTIALLSAAGCATRDRTINAESLKDRLAQLQEVKARVTASSYPGAFEEVRRICGQEDSEMTVSGELAKPYQYKQGMEYDYLDSKTHELVRIRVTIGDSVIQKINVIRDQPSTQPGGIDIHALGIDIRDF